MIFLKHVRNKIKGEYKTADSCYICSGSSKLQFHHLKCLSVEAKKLLLKEGYRDYPKDDDPRFEELVWKIALTPEIVNPQYYYTLCKSCHEELHSRFGQSYIVWKAVEKYIDKRRDE